MRRKSEEKENYNIYNYFKKTTRLFCCGETEKVFCKIATKILAKRTRDISVK